jgi:hypothetical protein
MAPGCFFNRAIRFGNFRLGAIRSDRLLPVGGVLIVRYRAEPIESCRCKILDRYLECVLYPLPRTEAYTEYDRLSERPHQTRIESTDGSDISAACKTAEDGHLFWKRSEWRTHQAPWHPRGAVFLSNTRLYGGYLIWTRFELPAALDFRFLPPTMSRTAGSALPDAKLRISLQSCTRGVFSEHLGRRLCR